MRRAFTFSVAYLVTIAGAPAGARPQAPSVRDYLGTWVMDVSGRTFMVLSLGLDGDRVVGSVALPKTFTLGQGDDIDASAEVAEQPVLRASLAGGRLEIVTALGDDPLLMTLRDPEHASVQIVAELGPWRLDRWRGSGDVHVATDWPAREPTHPSETVAALQARLKDMAAEDQAVRAPPISEADVKRVDEKHFPALLAIFEEQGWPRISVVGRKAEGNYWLLVQHQALHLPFLRRVLADLERAAAAGEASKVEYAFLYDRVQSFEGKPQRWGTQTVCKDGKAILEPVDDPAGLEQRRSDLRMPPIETYLASLPCATP